MEWPFETVSTGLSPIWSILNIGHVHFPSTFSLASNTGWTKLEAEGNDLCWIQFNQGVKSNPWLPDGAGCHYATTSTIWTCMTTWFHSFIARARANMLDNMQFLKKWKMVTKSYMEWNNGINWVRRGVTCPTHKKNIHAHIKNSAHIQTIGSLQVLWSSRHLCQILSREVIALWVLAWEKRLETLEVISVLWWHCYD